MTSSEDQRYDRQIRLWGADGQREIMASTVYCCGSDICATEFLKTMLLHGVKNVIIVDDAKVQEEDTLTNFFVTSASISQPRAEAAAVLLNELNPFAKVSAIVADPTTFPQFDEISGNVVVITTGNWTPAKLKELSDRCRAKCFKQIHLQSTGFFGAFYMDGGLHHLIEGAAAAQYPNELRLLNPFPELIQYFESFDLDKLDDKDHAHVPFLVILHQARTKLMKELNVPKLTYAHRQQLIDIVTSMRRKKQNASEIEWPYLEEEAFDEAIQRIALAYGSAFPPPETMDCFSVLTESVPEDNKEPFWRLTRAVHNFYTKHGVLPHYGGCPDLETSPEYYRQLRDLYAKKSKADWDEVVAEAGSDIDPEYVARYAKNVWRIGAVAYKPITEYLEQKPPAEYWDDSTREQFNRISCVQLLFIAARAFLAKHGRNPTDSEEDKAEILAAILEMGADKEEAPKFAEEFCRFKGSSLPSVVATLAAVLAEEATKLIIKQATPARGLVVYDAIHAILTVPQ